MVKLMGERNVQIDCNFGRILLATVHFHSFEPFTLDLTRNRAEFQAVTLCIAVFVVIIVGYGHFRTT